MNLPYAVQTLNKSNLLERKGTCPEHNKTSTKYRGEQPELDGNKTYWAFLCDYTKGKGSRGHIFINIIPRNVPRTQEELEEWTKKELMNKIVTFDKNKRTKR